MKQIFNRVSTDYEFNATTDGNPLVSKGNNLECLMSFYDDDGAMVFLDFLPTVIEELSLLIGNNREEVILYQSEDLTTDDGIVFRNTLEYEFLIHFSSEDYKILFLKWWEEKGTYEFWDFSLKYDIDFS